MTCDDTELWRDAQAIPLTMSVVADLATNQGNGFAAVAGLLEGRRVIAIGNGAAHYAALAMQSASWALPGPDVVAVPAGALMSGAFAFGPGDAPLVISSSGSLRDVVSLVEGGLFPKRYALVTSAPDSPLARSAAACLALPVPPQTSLTHTCCYLANIAACLHLFEALGGRPVAELAGIGPRLEAAIDAAPAWASGAAERLRAPAAPVQGAISFAPSCGIAAAYETALLLKEVTGLAAEGMEAREAATSGMYALDERFVVLAHAEPGDVVSAETLSTCAGRGARTLAVPGAERGDGLVMPFVTFPAALALAIELAQAAGRDVDRPDWANAYFATARTTGHG